MMIPEPIVPTINSGEIGPTPKIGVPNALVPQGRSTRTAQSGVVTVARVGEGELSVLAPVVLWANTRL